MTQLHEDWRAGAAPALPIVLAFDGRFRCGGAGEDGGDSKGDEGRTEDEPDPDELPGGPALPDWRHVPGRVVPPGGGGLPDWRHHPTRIDPTPGF
jgi:hypothetical protein